MLIWLVFEVVSATLQQTLTLPTMAAGIPSRPGASWLPSKTGITSTSLWTICLAAILALAFSGM